MSVPNLKKMISKARKLESKVEFEGFDNRNEYYKVGKYEVMIGKDLQCSCGKKFCEHVTAVVLAMSESFPRGETSKEKALTSPRNSWKTAKTKRKGGKRK